MILIILLFLLVFSYLLIKFIRIDKIMLSGQNLEDKNTYLIEYNLKNKHLEAKNNNAELLFSYPLYTLNISTSETIIPEEYDYIDEDEKMWGRMAIGGAIGGIIGGLPLAELGIFAGGLSSWKTKKVITKPKEHNLFLSIQTGIGKKYIFKIPGYQKFTINNLQMIVKDAKRVHKKIPENRGVLVRY